MSLEKTSSKSFTFFSKLLLIGFFLCPIFAFAAYQEFAPGFTVTLGEFLYNDDFTASTDDCTITVKDPTGATVVNAVTMSEYADGWHYHSFTPASIEGVWPSSMSCGTPGVDLIKQDKTFVVTSAISTTTIANSVWATATTTMNTVGSIGDQIRTNLNTTVSGVNTNTNSAILTASTSLAASLPASIWAYSARTLTSLSAIASDIWGAATRTLTGAGLNSGSLATLSDVTTASSSLASVINANTNTVVATASSSLAASLPASIWSYTSRTLTTLGSLADDVWTSATRTLTGSSLNSGSLATLSDVTNASSSLASSISAGTTAVNNNTNSVVATASSSLAASLPASVWSFSSRTLTSMASVADDVWNATTRTLTSLTLSSQSPWVVSMSDFSTIIPGDTYLATVNTIYNGTLTDSLALPTVTIYDPGRNVVVNSVAMTRTGVGTYSYSYVTSGSATSGVWETVINANVESGKTLPGNDYWNVASAPPQVIINNIGNTVIPNITANATITNEGTFGYEYQYEWCVVSAINNVCGGGDDVFYGSAAKFINPGEDFNTTLLADVPSVGNYYFKVVAYFGTESSSATRSFTATSQGNNPGGGGGSGGGGNSGGGGGGGTPAEIPSIPGVPNGACVGADLNGDGKVNSVDFSILLFFWKTSPPYKNTCVDINNDNSVNSVDFSIMLSQWGGKGVSVKP